MLTIRLAHSPDADDAFMFCGLATGRIHTRGHAYRHELSDIQSLNEQATRGLYDVTAISVHAWAHVRDRYRILTCGASVGDGCGPILVSRRAMTPSDLQEATIAIPGELTTAALALKIYQPSARTRTVRFDLILDAVARGDVDAGLIIHEGQLTYGDRKLQKMVDLGEWWKQQTGTPLPLGVLAIRRDHDDATAMTVGETIRESIAWALDNRAEALAYAREFGRGTDDNRLNRFVGMYVNEYTLFLGRRGEEAISLLFKLGAEAGLIPPGITPDLIGPMP